jgi:hypothetical protein
LIPYNLPSIPLNASTDSIASNIMFTNSLVQQNSWQKMHRTTKMQTWAFFALVKQHQNTKTTSIFWNTQKQKKKEDKCLASTEHCFFIFSPALLHCWHHRDKRNKTTSHQIPKIIIPS